MKGVKKVLCTRKLGSFNRYFGKDNKFKATHPVVDGHIGEGGEEGLPITQCDGPGFEASLGGADDHAVLLHLAEPENKKKCIEKKCTFK